MITIVEALQSLRPNASWNLIGDTYDGLGWIDESQTKPTEEEINTEITRLQAIEDSIQYQKDRKEQYPDIGDQLDMLWHAIDSGTLDKTSDFYTTLKEVKDNNPKP